MNKNDKKEWYDLKARITKTQDKRLLTVNAKEPHMQKLAELSKKAGARLIRADDQNMTIAELLGESPAPHDTGSYYSHDAEALIFSGFDRRELDAFLDALKANEVSIPLKAVCTPHNRGWSVAHLLDELIKEHKQLTGGDV